MNMIVPPRCEDVVGRVADLVDMGVHGQDREGGRTVSDAKCQVPSAKAVGGFLFCAEIAFSP